MSEWKKVFENNVSLYCRIIIQYLIKSGWKCISIDDYTKKMPDFPVREAVLSKFYKKGGLFPIVSQSKDLISGFSDDEKLLNKISEPIIIFGDHTQVVKYIDFDFVLGADGTKIITVTNDYNPKFLYYLIKSIDLHSNKYARHYSKLRKEKIPFQENSLSLQIKIVSFLDSLENNNISDEPYFDKETEKKILSLQKNSLNIQLIEKEIESQKNCIKQLRQNILQEAIEGKLTAVWRKQNPVQKDNPDYDAEALFKQIQKERNNEKKQKELTPITDEEKPFEIPESWKWVRLGEICKKLTDGSHNPPPNTGKGFPVISAMNIKNGEITFDKVARYTDEKGFEKENKRTNITRGDLIMGIIGASIGNIAIYNHDEKVIAQRSIAIIDSYLNNSYIEVILNSIYIQTQLKEKTFGSAQGGVYLGKISNLQVPLSPLNEQSEIVIQVENYLNKINVMEKQIVEREDITKRLMQSILKDAFEEN